MSRQDRKDFYAALLVVVVLFGIIGVCAALR